MELVQSHPARKNKDAPRMGHPMFVVAGRREMRDYAYSF